MGLEWRIREDQDKMYDALLVDYMLVDYTYRQRGCSRRFVSRFSTMFQSVSVATFLMTSFARRKHSSTVEDGSVSLG